MLGHLVSRHPPEVTQQESLRAWLSRLLARLMPRQKPTGSSDR